MANVIIYDPASTPIANKVVRYLRSVQESDYAAHPSVVINKDPSGDNPQVAALLAANVPMSEWKVSGSNVVQLTQADKDAIAAAEASAAATAAANYITASKADAKVIVDKVDRYGRMLRAFAEVMVDEISILRAQHSLAPRTLVQLRNAINAKIDAQS